MLTQGTFGRARRKLGFLGWLVGLILIYVVFLQLSGSEDNSEPLEDLAQENWGVEEASWRSKIPAALPFLPSPKSEPEVSSNIIIVGSFTDSVYGGVEKFLISNHLLSKERTVTVLDLSPKASQKQLKYKEELQLFAQSSVSEATESESDKPVQSTTPLERIKQHVAVQNVAPTMLSVQFVGLFNQGAAVDGVIFFSRDDESIEQSASALADALLRTSPNTIPWLIRVELRQLGVSPPRESREWFKETAESFPLHIFTFSVPTPIFGDPFSPPDSFVPATAHNALQHTPITVPFMITKPNDTTATAARPEIQETTTNGCAHNTIGVYAGDIASIITKGASKLARLRQSKYKKQNVDMYIPIDMPFEPFSQHDWAKLVISMTSSRSPLSGSSSDGDLFTVSRPYGSLNNNQKLASIIGPFEFSSAAEITGAYLTQLLALQGQYLQEQMKLSCNTELINPSLRTKKAALLESNGCNTQVLVQNFQDGKWWTLSCAQMISAGSPSLKSTLIFTRAVPSSHEVGHVRLRYLDADTTDGRNMRVEILCPQGDKLEEGWMPQEYIQVVSKGRWNHASSSTPTESRVFDVEFLDNERGGDAVIIRKGKKSLTFGEKVAINEEDHVYIPQWDEDSEHDAFRISSLCANTEGDVLGSSLMYFKNSKTTFTWKEHQCRDRIRASKRTQHLLRQVQSADALSAARALTSTHDAPQKWPEAVVDICPFDCNAPVTCIASASCRCTANRCGISKREQAGWLFPRQKSSERLQISANTKERDSLSAIVKQIPMEQLLQPFAKHAFFSPESRVRKIQLEPIIDQYMDIPESCDTQLELPLDRVELFQPEIGNVVLAGESWSCNREDEQDMHQTALDALAVVADGWGGIPQLLVNTRPFGKCYGNWERMDDIPWQKSDETVTVNWVVHGDHSTFCFRPDYDVIIPPESEHEAVLQKNFGEISQILSASSRPNWLFVSTIQPIGYAAISRMRIIDALKGVKDKVFYGESGPDLGQAKFCLVERENMSIGGGVADALYAGCIPVIVGDTIHPPLYDVLQYSHFSVVLPETQISTLIDVLDAIGDEEMKRMQANGLRIRNYLRWKGEKSANVIQMGVVASTMRVGGDQLGSWEYMQG